MNKFLTLVCLVMVLIGSVDAGESFTSKYARSAEKRYQKSVDIAKSEYVKSLKYALKKALASGDLEESKRIDNKIKELEKDPRDSFVGKWQPPQWGTIITIAKGGQITNSTTSKGFQKGELEYKDNKFIITWSNEKACTIKLQEDSILNTNNGKVWKLIK